MSEEKIYHCKKCGKDHTLEEVHMYPFCPACNTKMQKRRQFVERTSNGVRVGYRYACMEHGEMKHVTKCLCPQCGEVLYEKDSLSRSAIKGKQ